MTEEREGSRAALFWSAAAGIDFPALCDRICRLALEEPALPGRV